MSEVIFIHGIAQQQTAGPKVENDWILALSGGLEIAEFRATADRLRMPIGASERIEARMAYYGDLFVKPGAMGEGDDEPLTEAQEVLRDEIALEWLEQAAERARAPATKAIAEDELADLGGLDHGREKMGGRATGRKIVAALCRVPGIANVGMALASRFVNRTLNQVTRYLTDDDIRETVQDRIARLVTADTKLIIGHSLGSVAAYEAAHRLDRPLAVLLTLGSPLGLRSIVLERLRPSASFPPAVRRWVNIADPNDFIAAEPDLGPLFAAQMPTAAVFDSGWVVDSEDDPHSAERYLVKRQVGEVVGVALS